MILYHFTRPKHLPVIMQGGLRAALCNAENSFSGVPPVVWLTTKPSLVPTLQEKEAMLKTGILVKDSLMPGCTVCLRVRLPSHARQLKHFKTWARKKRLHLKTQIPFMPDEWWMNFGDIAPACLKVFKHVPVGSPVLIMKDIRKAYLAGAEVRISPEVRAEYLSED